MNSESETTKPSMKIPIIDFSAQSLKPKTPKWESVKNQVLEALEHFGCFEALFDQVNNNQVFEATKEFFDLPSEIKQLNVSEKPFYSYGSFNNAQDGLSHEAVFIENPNINQKVEKFASVSWPQGNPRFCEAINSYTEQVSELDRTIRKMIFEGLGIEKHLEDHFDSSKYAFRIIRYDKPETNNNDQKRTIEHRDKGYLAILSQNGINGLEIQTKEGEWIAVKPSIGSLVVILGEVFSFALTNGRLHCPYHGVRMSGDKARYSTVLFSSPKDDYLINTPKELVDEKHPLKYKPFTHSGYLKFLFTEGKAMQSDDTLKSYCGI